MPVTDEFRLRDELDNAAAAARDPGDMVERMYARAGRKQRNRRLAQAGVAAGLLPLVVVTGLSVINALPEPTPLPPAASGGWTTFSAAPTVTGMPLPSPSGTAAPTAQPTAPWGGLDLTPRVEVRPESDGAAAYLVLDDKEIRLPDVPEPWMLRADELRTGWFLARVDNDYVRGTEEPPGPGLYVAPDGTVTEVLGQVILLRDRGFELLLRDGVWRLVSTATSTGRTAPAWGDTIEYVQGTPAGVFIAMSSDGGRVETRLWPEPGGDPVPVSLPGRPIARTGSTTEVFTLIDAQPGCVARVDLPSRAVVEVGCGLSGHPIYRAIDGRPTVLAQDGSVLTMMDLSTGETARSSSASLPLSDDWKKLVAYSAVPSAQGGAVLVRCDISNLWSDGSLSCQQHDLQGRGLLGVPPRSD